MKRAEAKIDPVLAVFRDQVLFLKHNLNSRAIASIQTEAKKVKSEVAALISDIVLKDRLYRAGLADAMERWQSLLGK